MRAERRYSEAFKLQLIREIAEGRWDGVASASAAYRIGGAVTVRNWMERYGYGHLLKRVMHVRTPGEVDELKRLKVEVRRLKEALADAHLDVKLSEAFFEVVCKRHGEDPVEVKKKIAGPLRTGSAGCRAAEGK